MADDFDFDYADELDAMEEFEPPSHSPEKSKRMLCFETPKTKKSNENQDLNDSLPLTPLESPSVPFNGSLLHNATPLSRSEKRGRSQDDFAMLSDDDMYDMDLPSIDVPARKKPRLSDKFEELRTEKDDSVSPPGSPTAEDKIVTIRRKKAVEKDDTERNIAQDYDFERKRVFRRIPTGDFIGTTGYEGQRVYMRVKSELDLDLEFSNVGKTVKKTQLLAVSLEELKDQLEMERQQKLMEDAERLTEEIHSNLKGGEESDEEDGNVDDDVSDSRTLLWVEKYSPKQYTDLLSEELTNRTLLHWLKLWDHVVFNKEVTNKNKNKDKDKKKTGKDFKKKKFGADLIEDELDKYNRPMQKVALLNGPPGLGKTTLAHILARHAGYNMVEINASDDRSADVFKKKIEAATQMKSVLEADPRPNCLVIDEIDGAPQPAINMLLNLIKKTDEGGGKKKKEGGMLLRPIICICNDQYVPSLRLLRQNALVINFPQTEPAKLASRLYEVTRKENLKADMNSLLALCEKTDNDIRSCLNTLQFIRRQCKELSLRLIQTMNVGQKDSQKSLFSVWNDIFTLPRPKRNRYLNINDLRNEEWKINNTSPAARFQNVLQATYSSGEYDKVIQGLFENYLECKYKDPKMDGLNFAMDWLCFVDNASQYIAHKQDYCLLPYIPFVTVTFHMLFASNQALRVQYPHSQYEASVKLTKSKNLVTAMLTDMIPSVRKYLDQGKTVLEVLPPMMDIILPTLRPVNTQLYSTREKEELAQLIRIMIAYNMTYQQEKSPEGQYIYCLDPKVDEVVKFEGMKQQRTLTYAAKQLISREIEMEKMRRSETGRGEASRSKGVPPSASSSSVDQKPGEEFIPNHKRRLDPKAVSVVQTEQVVRDFFGRIIKKKIPEAKSKTDTEGEEKNRKKNVLNTDIWFHFKGGFSNAVRRNVRVEDFL